MAKVPRAGGHVTSTGLAALPPLDDTLAGVHQTKELRPAPLHRVGILNAPWRCDGHAFLRGEKSVCNTCLNHGMLNASHTTQSHMANGSRGGARMDRDGIRSPTHYFIGAEDPELHFLDLLQRSRRVIAKVRHVV